MERSALFTFTLTDQAKTARRQKTSLQVDASPRQHVSRLHMRLASATVSVRLPGRATRGASAPRGRQLIACFSQEGKGLWVCRVHIEGLCLRNCAPSLPATCARHHAPTARPPHLLPLRATTLLFTPNSSLIRMMS